MTETLFGTLAPLAGQVATEIVDGRLKAYNNEAVDGFLDRFKSRKREDYEDRGQISLYRQVQKQFEKDLEGENLESLIGKDRAARDKHLDRIWKAAAGDLLEKRVSTKSPSRPAGSSAAGGGGMGETPKGGGYKLSEREKTQLLRTMGKEAAEAAIRDIEGALAGVREE